MTLVESHEKKYCSVIKRERLSCLDLTEPQYKNIIKGLRERLQRESAIPDEDIEEAIKQIINWPTLGGVKGSLKLGHDEKALIGTTNYTEIKKELKQIISAEVRRRQEESLLQKYETQRTPKKEGFHRNRAKKPNDIWAIDFLNIKFLGYTFAVCVIYDQFTQGYCSIQADEIASAELAIRTVKEAVSKAGGPPKRFILSDNGKQFLSYSYSELLKDNQIGSRFIPPGQPWFNGALESGNRDLRRLIYTIAIYLAVETPSVARPGASIKEKLQFLKECCHNARDKINTEIVRKKFQTTPENVKQGKVEEKQQAMKVFKEKKLKIRKDRMDELEKTKAKKHKSMEEKVITIGKKIAATFNLDYLIAVNEALNRRYSIIQS